MIETLVINITIMLILAYLLIKYLVPWQVHKDMAGDAIENCEYSTFEEFKKAFDKYKDDFEYYGQWPESLFVYAWNFPRFGVRARIHARLYMIDGKYYKFKFFDYLRVQNYVDKFIKENKEELLSRERTLSI